MTPALVPVSGVTEVLETSFVISNLFYYSDINPSA